MTAGGLFINSLEIRETRKRRILSTIPKPLSYVFYGIDFLLHRVIPKIKPVNSIYFYLTKGQNRAITKAEVIGRLYSCGFQIVDDKTFDGKLYFIAKKIREPFFDKRPTYAPLIYLKRVGRYGKIINVAKIRTMHPYAEYLQEYLYDKNNLNEGGKIKNDFRISSAGHLFRKYWIDELPMLINLIKGDIKLVGVRPLSEHYFSLYPREIQKKRTLFKPGLFPPFYVDMPKTLDEIVKSEEKYLDLYMKNPILTDLKYFFKIIANIVFKGKRSA
ncbi:MAG: sugar transferase [Bacteroidota bacterium]